MQGGNNGPETITIREIADGIKAVYYVYDFSNKIGRTMTWVDSEAKSTIFGPNGGGSAVVPFNNANMDGLRYFVVGCFDKRGFFGFEKVAKAVSNPAVSDCP